MHVTSSQGAVEEMIHGTIVRDPYRWLEDRNLPDTAAWIQAQDEHSSSYFAGCHDLSSIRARVRAYLDVPVIDQPAKIGTRYFYRRRGVGDEQASIYCRDMHTQEEQLLVSAPDDAFSSIRIHQIAPDGSLMAYEFRRGGTDRKDIRIFDIERRSEYDGNSQADWFRGLVFDGDRRGYFYCQQESEDAPHHIVRWRQLRGGSEDRLCFQTVRSEGSKLLLTPDTTRLGIIHLYRASGLGAIDFWVADSQASGNWRRVFTRRTLPFLPLLVQGRIFASTLGAETNPRITEFDLDGSEVRTVFHQPPGQLLQLVIGFDALLTHSFHEMKSKILQWTLDGEVRQEIAIPLDSTVRLFPASARSQRSLFYSLESIESPPQTFEIDLAKEHTDLWSPAGFQAPRAPMTIQRSSYKAWDGTRIPLTLASCGPGVDSSEGHCIMTAYGGFSVPGTLAFSVLIAVLLDLGASFALPHIRGGGDLGRDWHEAGRGRQRQQSIDDFICAAEFLSDFKITRPDKLGVVGGSNSGLLVAAAMTQRPECFGAVLCIAPLLDMIRYEVFDRAARWRNEYGTAADAEDFHALLAYSPYHHVTEGVNYPATMFVTGDADDRCNPAHVRKMAAAMQAGTAQKSPIVVDYSEARGHMPVLPLTMRVEALTRRIAFLCRELKITIP